MRATRVELRKVDRGNWRAMLKLETRPDQREFVAAPSWSLVGSMVKRYGDNFDYLPRAIWDGERVVGYVTMVCDPATEDQYWIDDIMIDASCQGQGYGRLAMVEALKLILREYRRCGKIQLTCYERNVSASALYLSLGFRKNGRLNEMNREPDYELVPPTLDKFRS